MTDAHDPDDWAALTEARLLDAALPLSGELGWSPRLVVRAAKAVGLSPAEAELLLPGGPRDLIALLSRRHDQAALAALSDVDPASLRVRDRIRCGVEARVDAAMADETASRRAAGFLALPSNAPLGARLVWASADSLWRWAGDVSADENHYSKRALLAGLLGSTLAVRLSASNAAAKEHLERGIEAVMAFERAKARFRSDDLATRAVEALARLRYGRRAEGSGATPA